MSDKLGTAVLYLKTDSKGLTKGLEGAKVKAKKFGKVMAATFVLPLAMLIKKSIGAASDFEKTMAKIESLVGISHEQVGDWSSELLELGPELGKTPLELADALFFITSAGLEGAEAIDVLTIAAKASAAGLGETADIADAMTSVINAFGKENITVSKAADILFGTVREGKTAAEELSGSLGGIIPLAAQMEVEFSEVGAMIASMTRVGVPAAEAVTSITALFSGLLKETKPGAEALAAVGTSFQELREQVKEKGLLDVLLTLDEKFEGNATSMGKVFRNIRALRGSMALLGENADTSIEIFESLKNATGDVEEGFAIASETMDFKLNKSSATLNSSLIKLGDVIGPAMMPHIETAVGWIKTLVDNFSSLDEGIQGVILIIIGVAGLSVILLGLLGPIGLVAGAVAALAIGLVLNWDDIVKAAKGWADTFSTIFDNLYDYLSGKKGGILGMFNDLGIFLFDWAAKWGDILTMPWLKGRLNGGSPAPFVPSTPEQLSAAIGMQRGADFTVPSGFENDTFPMLAETGEHVSITPRGKSRGGGIVIDIHDNILAGTNLREFAIILREELESVEVLGV